MTKLWIAAGMVAALFAASCGSGAALAPESNLTTGMVEGYITEADIARGTSAVDDGVPGVEVWCEEPGTGQRLGQDTTDSNGYYRIEGLAEGQEMMLRFRYRHAVQNGNQGGSQEPVEIEGEQQIMLQAREQLELNIRVRQYDDNSDGVPDEVDCANSQMQVRLRGGGTGADEE